MKKTIINLDRIKLNNLLAIFTERAKIQGYNVKEYREKQIEFLLGAIATIDLLNDNGISCCPPFIYVRIIRGEVIS